MGELKRRKPGPAPSPEVATRNAGWAVRHLGGETPTTIAREANVSVSLVRKVLIEQGALRRRASSAKPARPPAPARANNARPQSDDERAARRERRRAYMAAYVAEWRAQPEHRGDVRRQHAAYREKNRVAIRERARLGYTPLTEEERLARVAERALARGETALARLFAEAADLEDML